VPPYYSGRSAVITDLLAPSHLLLLLVVALLVLGPKRLPEAGRALGRGVRELKGGLAGDAPEEPADEKGRADDSGAGPGD
jgi:sec-independent protein translocase protein TatA